MNVIKTHQLVCLALALQFATTTVFSNEVTTPVWKIGLFKKKLPSGNHAPAPSNKAPVTYRIGLYTKMVQVPSLSGMSYQEASIKLENLGLKANQNNSNGMPQDHVKYQGVKAGTKVKAGTVVSLGLVVTVPNIVGMTLEEAYDTLKSGGLKMNYNKQCSSDFKVTHQNPLPGSTIARGFSVSGQCMVLVPDVTGMSMTEAQGALSNANLKSKSITTFQSSDRVLEQNNARKMVPALSTIKLLPGVMVPNLIGRSVSSANQMLAEAGIKGNPTIVKVPTRSQFLHGRTKVDWQAFVPGNYIPRTKSMNVRIKRAVYVAPRVPNCSKCGHSGCNGGCQQTPRKPIRKPIRRPIVG